MGLAYQVFIALPAQGGNQLAGTPGGVSADTAAADTELSDTATADTGVAADTAGAFFAARVDGEPLWPYNPNPNPNPNPSPNPNPNPKP